MNRLVIYVYDIYIASVLHMDETANGHRGTGSRHCTTQFIVETSLCEGRLAENSNNCAFSLIVQPLCLTCSLMCMLIEVTRGLSARSLQLDAVLSLLQDVRRRNKGK